MSIDVLWVGTRRGALPGAAWVATVADATKIVRLAIVECVVLSDVAMPSRAVRRLRAAAPALRVAVLTQNAAHADRLACAAADAVYYGSDEAEAIEAARGPLTHRAPLLH